MADKKRGLLGYTGEQITNPVRAIRKNCLDCMCGSSREVELCTITYCPLYPFRFGINPYRNGRTLSDEEKAALSERLKTTQTNRAANDGMSRE